MRGLRTPSQRASNVTVPWELPGPGQLSRNWQKREVVCDVTPGCSRKYKGSVFLFLFSFPWTSSAASPDNDCSYEEATCVLSRGKLSLLPCLSKGKGAQIGEIEPSQPSVG